MNFGSEVIPSIANGTLIGPPLPPVEFKPRRLPIAGPSAPDGPTIAPFGNSSLRQGSQLQRQ